jgi:hypothetical protein
MEVFELLTMYERKCVNYYQVNIEGGKRTKIDSIYFAVDDDSCTLATKDVDRLINFNIVNIYGLSLLEFLQTHSKN